MSKILVINSGSSSIKYQLFRVQDWAVCAAGSVTRIGEPDSRFEHKLTDPDAQPRSMTQTDAIADHQAGLDRIMHALSEFGGLENAGELSAIGHRVVHGGEAFSAPTRIDDAVTDAIRDMIPLAPLHNPANLEGIDVARKLFPDVPQVAVFDTAFHQTMPAESYRYAIPETLYREHGIRRYGFHGTSHQYVSKRAAAFLGKAPEQTNLITLHLGNGASAAAIRNGRCIDTSMGMTPLEGLVMGSRSGDIDPAIVFYLCRQGGLSVEEVDRLLNKDSGLVGLTGVNDMREIRRRAEDGDEHAQLALDLFVHRLKKYIGAYIAELGRVDAIVFTGGIGENDALLRASVCSDMQALGLSLDIPANRSTHDGERLISEQTHPVAVLVIPTNEELEIAGQTWQSVQASG